MTTAPRHHDRSPKTYTDGTGRPSARTLDQAKVVRTVNVTGSVWDAGKKRAAQDQVSLSHAIGLLIEAYTNDLVSLDAITAQLDALHDEGEAVER
ncbi:hypothetical protein [Streptomyces sp. E-08]|uniref:hypothetical protein n=1 Tax=Streptomyces sp. E-08 TaxID=3404047 RepID=UPI003CF5D853